MSYRNAQIEALSEFHDSELGRGPGDKSERAWLRYAKAVEKAFGADIDLDGREGSGVCIDGAYRAFEAGATVAAYLANPRTYL